MAHCGCVTVGQTVSPRSSSVIVLTMFYIDLLGALDRHGVRYVLAGGLALNLHGVERATMDVDLAVALDSGNLLCLIEAAKSLGLVPVAPIRIEDIADPAKRAVWIESKHLVAVGLRSPVPGTPTVDILVIETVPFESMYSRREVRQIAGVAVHVVCIDDLIAMKQAAGRQQDIADIRALKQVKQIKS